MISTPLSVASPFQVLARARSVTSSSANSVDESKALTIPNPFKSLGNNSSENIASKDSSDGGTLECPAHPNTDASRLWFGEEQDIGEALFSSAPRSLRGLRSRYSVERDDVLGLAWTDTEVLVRSRNTFVENPTDDSTCRSFTSEWEKVYPLIPSRKSTRMMLERSWRYNSLTARRSWSWGSVSPSCCDVCNAHPA